MKLIVVTGGVISGLGKGITAASLGTLMKLSGYRVTMMKLDPYLQIDAGTMSPFEHGETFVTDDGFETDLDLGHYERFINESLTKKSSVTTGQIYLSVITRERKGDFLGKTVQVIPHVTNEVKDRIREVSQGSDITIVEVGGTVWDIEWPHFIEALRQLRAELGKENMLFVHVVPILHVSTSGEMKTKALQHSVIKLRELWIYANILVCRTDVPLTDDLKQKIAMFSDLDNDHIIEARDQKSIYSVPLAFADQNLHNIVSQRFFGKPANCDLIDWKQRVHRLLAPNKEVNIAIAGKYTALDDAYISVVESLKHAGSANDTKIHIHWIDTEQYEWADRELLLAEHLESLWIQGILVPGWFGNRGIEGMINIADYARRHKIPYLWLCLGLQIATISFARNVCGLEKANSTEFDANTPHPIVDFLEEQKDILQKWGTMRLGSYPAILAPGTTVHSLYSQDQWITENWPLHITERHRHRYEVNPDYHHVLLEYGFVFGGISPDGNLVEFIEIKAHPFYLATQAHPEFKSCLQHPHPLFFGFVKASTWE